MEEDATFFHDHSTTEGRLSLCLHRMKWKYLIPPAVFLTAFASIGILIASIEANDPQGKVQLAPGNSLLGSDDPAPRREKKSAGWTVITYPSPGVVQAEGCENGLYPFEGFDSTFDPSSARHLRISYLVINAPALTSALREWTNLESIVMENIWVNGNYSRVYLPNLKKFIYHQYRNGKTDQYKQPDTLKQTLFFDKSPTGTWDLHKDLLNLNVTVQVSVEGTKILEIEPEWGEINVNTHDCEQYINNFDKVRSFHLTSLTLSWCSLKGDTIKKLEDNSDNLTFLSLNNAIPPSTEELGRVTSSLRNLKELHLFHRFHCDWPGYEIFLNVSSLSKSLETLSLSNLDMTHDSVANQVRNLSLDKYVGEKVVQNFNSIFPNLKTLALFNITADQGYQILEKVIVTTSEVKPELVIVTNLTRFKLSDVPSPNSKVQVGSSVQQVENVLELAGVSKSVSDFKLELGDNGKYRGRELTSFESHFYRFTRLAFKKVDNWSDYIKWDSDPK